MKRISAHKGVIGLIVVNHEGIPIKTTLDNSTTTQYASLLQQLTAKARSVVRDIDPQNDLTFLRIRSKKHEIMVAPGLFFFNRQKKGASGIFSKFYNKLESYKMTLLCDLNRKKEIK